MALSARNAALPRRPSNKRKTKALQDSPAAALSNRQQTISIIIDCQGDSVLPICSPG